MTMIYIPGYLGNAMRRVTSVTPSQVANSKYPAINLGSGLPSKPFKFNDVGADVSVVADINFLLNHHMENWTGTSLGNWIPGDGAGTYGKESTIIQGGIEGGLYSVWIKGVKELYQDVEVLTGKDYKFRVALYGNGSQIIRLRIQDLDTYKWLSPTFIWTVGLNNCASKTTTGWETTEGSFVVEAGNQYKTKLRVILDSSGGTVNQYIDDMYLIPQINFLSVHGHNIPSGADLNLRASTDDFGSSDNDKGIPVIAQPSFYMTFAATRYRWWKLLMATESVGDPIWMGEWSLGHATTISHRPQFALPINVRQPRTTVEIQPSGQLYIKSEAYQPSREAELSFYADSESYLTEMRENILQASAWGEEPLIIVPDTNHTRVLHCRPISNEFPFLIEPGSLWRYDLGVREDAYPVAGF